MAKKENTKESRESTFRGVRRGLILATLVSAGLTALMWGAIQLENFLIRDSQFTLVAPSDPGEPSPGVSISGVQHSSPESVAAIFDRDYGRSIYLVPLRQRREDLLRRSWVRDASVTRVWPNRIQVRIAEREPVAFLQLSGEGAISMVDADGHILLQEAPEKLRLPVVSGISREQREEDRRLRARLVVKLLRDVGELSAGISEVDASDPDNLKVMQDAGGKAVTLIIGNRHFKRRLEKFKQNAEDLLRRDPEKAIFDLRRDGSIYARPSQTAMAAEGPAVQ